MKLTEDNLCGKIFNRWEVIRFSRKIGYNKYFICKCLDCETEHEVYIQSVVSGKSKSCGCKSRKNTAYKINKKYNKFDIINNVVYVHIDNDENKIMMCDLEDWSRLDKYYWRDVRGYAETTINYKHYKFHRMAMNIDNKKIKIDHINGNTMDNRKINLRLCNDQENSFNRYKNSNNTSGYKGVYFDKERGKWRGAIQYNGRSYKSPKRYDRPEDAYEWYKNKSNELFKEFSVFNSRGNW